MLSYSIRRQLAPVEKDALLGGSSGPSAHSDLLAHLLFHRNITNAESAGRFLSPDYERDTHDPSLLQDADKAAVRIIQAIKSEEKIAIYADYDADGIPAGAIWHDLFSRIGYKNFLVYIPHRHNEGFGLNEAAVAELALAGVKLIVTVDCGIADAGAVEKANSLGMEVIVTDHHEPPESGLPPAFAVVDPKRVDCAYPDKNLCGAGVSFKLIQALLAKERFGLKEGHEKWLLDLVGIATLSDMVPLTGENRVFASYGLAVLRKTPRKGLKKLFSKLKIAQAHLTEDDINFMVTPRINAASRMGKPMDAFDLLVADDEGKAEASVDHLNSINDERKGVVASLVKEVKKIVRERHGERMPSVIVLGNPEWRPSLLGLAANSCAEEFRRPVFLWGRDGENTIKGSCRSEGKSSVIAIMRAAPATAFATFGGHHHSGGFAVANDAIHYLDQRLNEAAEANASQIGDDERVREIDAELMLSEVGYRLYSEIARLAPFGVGNPKPVFLFRRVRPSAVRRFGKANDHLELTFDQGAGRKVSAISFFGVANDWAAEVTVGREMDLLASVEKSMFRGRPELRLRVEDVILL